MAYVKVRFTNGNEHTAGLVMDAEKVSHATITDLSRAFPYSEAGKMRRLDVSPRYETWEEAFNHEFK